MGDVRMRSDYELEIRREDGTVQAIPMHATAYQATKAMTALGCALNMSGVKEVVLWVCTRIGRVRHNAIKFGTIKKATEAA